MSIDEFTVVLYSSRNLRLTIIFSGELMLLLVLPTVALLSFMCIPSTWANRKSQEMRQLVTHLTALQFLIVATFSILCCAGLLDPGAFVFLSFPMQIPISLTIFFDGAAGFMLSLVSFVGWVISRFSIRYLDGDPGQGQFYRWVAFTIGAVSLMTLAGHLLLFFAGWLLMSLGLHQLLLQYGQRPAARRAAWTKFAVSRLGESALLAALVILDLEFGTLDLENLFQQIQTTIQTGNANTSIAVVGWLLVVTAALKSVQFPFHFWLPQTMETPTPVSALMHAGIVNAGGYLIIRMSPIVGLVPEALATLAMIGTVTTCLAAMAMLTQTSVKQSLAYSTIAQMGFMMLQCGLGAYSAAMLHILAHSLYKAHAFLACGSVLTQQVATKGIRDSHFYRPGSWGKLMTAMILVLTFCELALVGSGLQLSKKPGGYLLGSLLVLALTSWLWQIFMTSKRQTIVFGTAVTGVLVLAYLVSFQLVDAVLNRTTAAVTYATVATHPALCTMVATIAICSFGLLAALQYMLLGGGPPARLAPLYVHAQNGFYISAMVRRLWP